MVWVPRGLHGLDPVALQDEEDLLDLGVSESIVPLPAPG